MTVEVGGALAAQRFFASPQRLSAFGELRGERAT
jgi:hypothetical protein